MPIKVHRQKRPLSEDERELIKFWIASYERPIFWRVLSVSALFILVLMASTLMLSSVSSICIIVFWLCLGSLLFAWSYISIRNEHDAKLNVILSLDLENAPAVMDIFHEDLTAEDFEQFHPKSNKHAPEPGDQLIITRDDGELISIEFVSDESWVHLTPMSKASG